MKKETRKIASERGQGEQVPGLPSGSNLWKFVIQTLLAILTAIATTLGVTSCMGAICREEKGSAESTKRPFPVKFFRTFGTLNGLLSVSGVHPRLDDWCSPSSSVSPSCFYRINTLVPTAISLPLFFQHFSYRAVAHSDDVDTAL